MKDVQYDLTQGSVPRCMLRFSVPYLIACFLQTFYGLADLLITGRFYGADALTAVSVGSQVMHMLTVVLVGLAMGATVCVSKSLGSGKMKDTAGYIGSAASVFALLSVVLTAALLLCMGPILRVLSVPEESLVYTRQYLTICFCGVPFITAYNVLSSLFRGLGDTRRPLYFVAIAGVLNVLLDLVLIGRFRMGAAGAAAATVLSQGVSVLLAGIAVRRMQLPVRLTRQDLRPKREYAGDILRIGLPIALQEGLIQISFLVITVIANRRGVDIAAAVGVVEKIISFLFLVPSALLSTVSAFAARNAGAGLHARSRSALRWSVGVCIGFGLVCVGISALFSPQILSLFASDNEDVVRFGSEYLRAYSIDCVLAGVHFCFSGFFSAYSRSGFSFLHNILSVTLVRIPLAYWTSLRFPDTLFPMGLAAPMGSLLSIAICLALFYAFKPYWQTETI